MKTDSIEIRVQAGEKTAFKNAAEIAGIPLSAWIRERLRRTSVKELEDASMPIDFLQRHS
jgi:predicted DNA binding CopG/RHH family protein